jgi:hypothetical protein
VRICVTIGLVDNDILLKLIAFQLMDETLDLLGLSLNSLRVLSSAQFVFRDRQKQQSQQEKPKQQGYTDEIWEQAIAFCKCCQTLDPFGLELEPSILNEYKQLAPFAEEINEGETALILATARSADFLLLTGDKKCLQTLPRIPRSIYRRLQGRVLCLEQIILKLIDHLGFERVQILIQPAIQCDQSIQFCFGYSRPAPESQVRHALQSCIDQIHHLAPGLLGTLA